MTAHIRKYKAFVILLFVSMIVTYVSQHSIAEHTHQSDKAMVKTVMATVAGHTASSLSERISLHSKPILKYLITGISLYKQDGFFRSVCSPFISSVSFLTGNSSILKRICILRI